MLLACMILLSRNDAYKGCVCKVQKFTIATVNDLSVEIREATTGRFGKSVKDHYP